MTCFSRTWSSVPTEPEVASMAFSGCPSDQGYPSARCRLATFSGSVGRCASAPFQRRFNSLSGPPATFITSRAPTGKGGDRSV
jgi:hypothetical protein